MTSRPLTPARAPEGSGGAGRRGGAVAGPCSAVSRAAGSALGFGSADPLGKCAPGAHLAPPLPAGERAGVRGCR